MKPHVHKDSQGVVLEVGQKVAYNKSGNVVPGIIHKLGKEIQVEYAGNQPIYDYDWDKGWNPDTGYSKTLREKVISRVRNGSSLLVLG